MSSPLLHLGLDTHLFKDFLCEYQKNNIIYKKVMIFTQFADNIIIINYITITFLNILSLVLNFRQKTFNLHLQIEKN